MARLFRRRGLSLFLGPIWLFYRLDRERILLFWLEPELLERRFNWSGGRVVVDRLTGQTSNPKFFAGGDCTNGGREVVDAVAEGKRAGIGIAAWLEAQREQV